MEENTKTTTTTTQFMYINFVVGGYTHVRGYPVPRSPTRF